jgi:hypothetical protein
VRKIATVAVVLSVFSLGCASTARYMVAEPAVQASKLTETGLPDAFKDRISMKCMLEDEGTCVYSGVFYDHAATFAKATRADRDALAYVLLTTASDNCSWFLNRVFANRSGVSGIRDGIKNLMTGAAALTAKPSPGISAALGFANLFADSTVKSLEANEFASKTFDVIESAIKTQRNKTETEILLKLGSDIDKYPVGALLLDVSRLKDQCTLTAGIRGLQATASTEEQKSETSRKTAATALTGVTVQ